MAKHQNFYSNHIKLAPEILGEFGRLTVDLEKSQSYLDAYDKFYGINSDFNINVLIKNRAELVNEKYSMSIKDKVYKPFIYRLEKNWIW